MLTAPIGATARALKRFITRTTAMIAHVQDDLLFYFNQMPLSGTIFKYKIKLLKQYDISTLPLWRFMEPLWNQSEPKSRALERAIAVLRHCFDPLKATLSRYKMQ
ncbi:hypothetical protein [Brucella pseudogrignonensis]|uniref:hypothetical protein n=1 Tax=Brucella pseudogrignonensis TaxID=419475 RepID=UPI0038CFDFE4